MKKYLITMLSVFAIASSCSKDDNIQVDSVKINNQTTELRSRVSYFDELVKVNPFTSSKTKAGENEKYEFRLRAEVDAPELNGKKMQATHVEIVDNMAFVSYNTQGSEYRGGVELFDISNQNKPVLKAQALFSDVDVSAVDYQNGKVYLAGAVDPESSNYTLTTPAVLIEMEVSPSGTILPINGIYDLPSFVGTDVAVDENYIYVTSGSKDGPLSIENGGLTILNLNRELVKSIAIKDPRSVTTNSETVYVLNSTDEIVEDFRKADFSPIGTQYLVQGPITAESKTEIHITENYLFVALNQSGLEVLNMGEATQKDYFKKPKTPEGGIDSDYVTNSVSVNEELILTGNGAAGIYVGEMIPEQNDKISFYGSMNFDSSVNFVESKEKSIFVASGTGGLKILTLKMN